MLVAATATAGCTAAEAPTPVAVDVPDDEVGRILPGPPDDADQDDRAPADDAATPLLDCDTALEATLTEAVDGQLTAITEQRWADALTYATPGFRASMDADGFAATITDGFPVVAAAAGRETGRCILRDTAEQATLFVRVVDVDGAEQELVYLFELTSEGWGIAGAVPTDGAPGVGGEDGTLTT